MNECDCIRADFSGYLDGAVSGAAMQKIASHLEGCAECASEFSDWQNAQRMLNSLGFAKAPEDLGLRLRIALSQESTRTRQEMLSRWRMRWQNTVRPLVLQASAGLASTILLLGSVSLLIGMFAAPQPLSARDHSADTIFGPRFLYTSVSPVNAIGNSDDPVVVEAYVNGEGRVYDFRVVSGAITPDTRSELESALLFSVFAPATTFGQPVRGTVLLSFSGVSVRG